MSCATRYFPLIGRPAPGPDAVSWPRWWTPIGRWRLFPRRLRFRSPRRRELSPDNTASACRSTGRRGSARSGLRCHRRLQHTTTLSTGCSQYKLPRSAPSNVRNPAAERKAPCARNLWRNVCGLLNTIQYSDFSGIQHCVNNPSYESA